MTARNVLDSFCENFLLAAKAPARDDVDRAQPKSPSGGANPRSKSTTTTYVGDVNVVGVGEDVIFNENCNATSAGGAAK